MPTSTRGQAAFSPSTSAPHWRGTYLAVEPPTRVVFIWGLPGSETMPAGSTTVEVVLTADGGHTVVSLTHHHLPTEHRPGHQKGRDAFLGALPTAVTRH